MNHQHQLPQSDNHIPAWLTSGLITVSTLSALVLAQPVLADTSDNNSATNSSVITTTTNYGSNLTVTTKVSVPQNGSSTSESSASQTSSSATPAANDSSSAATQVSNVGSSNVTATNSSAVASSSTSTSSDPASSAIGGESQAAASASSSSDSHVYKNFDESGITTQRVIHFEDVPEGADSTIVDQVETTKWSSDYDASTGVTTYTPQQDYVQYAFNPPAGYSATSSDVVLTSSGSNDIVPAEDLNAVTTLPADENINITFKSDEDSSDSDSSSDQSYITTERVIKFENVPTGSDDTVVEQDQVVKWEIQTDSTTGITTYIPQATEYHQYLFNAVTGYTASSSDTNLIDEIASNSYVVPVESLSSTTTLPTSSVVTISFTGTSNNSSSSSDNNDSSSGETSDHVYKDFDESEITSQLVIHFTNAPDGSNLTDEVETIRWSSDTDLTTGVTTYTPETTSYPAYSFNLPTGYTITLTGANLTIANGVATIDAIGIGATTSLPSNTQVSVSFAAELDQHVYKDFDESGITTQRTIHFTNVPADSDLADVTETIRWATDTDLTTGITTYIPESSSYGDYSFSLPTGYTASSNDANLTSTDSTVTVGQSGVTETTSLPSNSEVSVSFDYEEVTAQLTLVDDDENGSTINSYTITGNYGHNTSQTISIPKGYTVDASTLPSTVTDLGGTSLSFRGILNETGNIVVHLIHQTTTVSGTSADATAAQKKEFTVQVSDGNNHTATETLLFDRSMTTDLVTGNVTYGAWEAESSLMPMVVGTTTVSGDYETTDGQTISSVINDFLANSTNNNGTLSIELASSTNNSGSDNNSGTSTNNGGTDTSTTPVDNDQGNGNTSTSEPGQENDSNPTTSNNDNPQATVDYVDQNGQKVLSHTVTGEIDAPISFNSINQQVMLVRNGFRVVSDETARPINFTVAPQQFTVRVKQQAARVATAATSMNRYSRFFPAAKPQQQAAASKTADKTNSSDSKNKQNRGKSDKTSESTEALDAARMASMASHQKVVPSGSDDSQHSGTVAPGGGSDFSSELGQFFISLSGKINFGYNSDIK